MVKELLASRWDFIVFSGELEFGHTKDAAGTDEMVSGVGIERSFLILVGMTDC